MLHSLTLNSVLFPSKVWGKLFFPLLNFSGNVKTFFFSKSLVNDEKFKGSQEQRSSCSGKAAISRRAILFTCEISHHMHSKLKMMHACYKSNLTYGAMHMHTNQTEKMCKLMGMSSCSLYAHKHKIHSFTIPSCNIIYAFK